jgi:hypothetical protein
LPHYENGTHNGTRAGRNKNQEKIKTSQAEVGAWQKEMMACQEVMDFCLESKESTSLVVETEHEGVPKEEAAVKPGRALKKWYGNLNLAIGRCQKPKKRTQGSGGSWKNLAAMPFLHGIRDKARTKLFQELRKDGRLGQDTGQNWKASVE